MIFLDNSEKDSGRFMFWKWSLWSIGGGAGVEWYFMGKVVYPKKYSILWLVFYIQSGSK